jgi:hypothetical protein
MDSNQIHNAMKMRLPVAYEGMRYDRILEYVSFYDKDGKRRLSLVLLLGNSTFRVPADKVELWED